MPKRGGYVEAFMVLAILTIIYLIGLLASLLSGKLKVPHALLLLLGGVALGRTCLWIPESFAASIAVLALVIVLFDSISRLREFDSFSHSTMKFSLLSLLLSVILIPTLAYFLFGIGDVYLAIIFSVVICGTEPLLAGNKFHKATELLKVESLLITPLIIIVPAIILEIRKGTGILGGVSPMLAEFGLGIGIGLIAGIFLMKLVKNNCEPYLAMLTIIAAALFTYVAAEMLGGNGVLAVAVLGILFGSRHLSGKRHLGSLSSMFAYALGIIVFVSAAMLARLDLSFAFLFNAFLLFVVYVLLRFIAVSLSLKEELSLRQRVFVSLNCPKGLAVAVMALSLAVFVTRGNVVSLLVVFMAYSLIVSAIATGIIKLHAK